jgi:hypothetical protein
MLKAFLAKQSDGKILIISSRRSYTAMLLHDLRDLNFVSYENITGPLRDCPEHARVIFQIESCLRLPSDIQPRDIIIFDEVSQLGAQIFNESGPATFSKAAQMDQNVADLTPFLFSGQAWHGLMSVRPLVEAARAVVVCDNDLCTAQIDAFVHTARLGKDFAVHINTATHWTQQLRGGTGIAHFSEGEGGYRAMEKRLMDELQRQDRARCTGLAWHGVGAACHTRTQADALARMAIDVGIPKDLIKLYTGETCPATKKADFADATRAWEGMALVIFTATLSVGVSCNSTHMKTVYAFFTSHLMHACQSVQMLFRMREMETLWIAYHAPRATDEPSSVQAMLECLTASHTRRNMIPNLFRHDRNPFMPKSLKSATNAHDLQVALEMVWEGQLWLANFVDATRSHEAFLQRVEQVLLRAGIRMSRLEIDEEPGLDLTMLSKAARLGRLEATKLELKAVRASHREATQGAQQLRALDIATLAAEHEQKGSSDCSILAGYYYYYYYDY